MSDTADLLLEGFVRIPELCAVLVVYELSAAGGGKVFRSLVAVRRLPLHGLPSRVYSDLHVLIIVSGVCREVGDCGQCGVVQQVQFPYAAVLEEGTLPV